MRMIYTSFMVFILLVSCSKSEEERCGTVPVIDSELFENTPTSHYQIRGATIRRGCLEVNLAASGCDGRRWEVRLIENNDPEELYPDVKFLKIEFISFEDCEAYIYKNYQFNLSMGTYKDDIKIRLEGWDRDLIYN